MPTQLVRDHGIFDSYTVERLHRRVKQHAKPLSNTRRFERTILERVTADHCFDATVSDGAALGTVGPVREATARALRGAPANAASDFCSYHGKQQCSTDDFIKAFGSVGKIIKFVTIGADNAVCVIVRKCVEVNNTEGYWSIVEVSENFAVWDASAFDGAKIAVAWRQFGECASSILVLRVPELPHFCESSATKRFETRSWHMQPLEASLDK